MSARPLILLVDDEYAITDNLAPSTLRRRGMVPVGLSRPHTAAARCRRPAIATRGGVQGYRAGGGGGPCHAIGRCGPRSGALAADRRQWGRLVGVRWNDSRGNRGSGATSRPPHTHVRVQRRSIGLRRFRPPGPGVDPITGRAEAEPLEALLVDLETFGCRFEAGDGEWMR